MLPLTRQRPPPRTPRTVRTIADRTITSSSPSTTEPTFRRQRTSLAVRSNQITAILIDRPITHAKSHMFDGSSGVGPHRPEPTCQANARAPHRHSEENACYDKTPVPKMYQAPRLKSSITSNLTSARKSTSTITMVEVQPQEQSDDLGK